MPGGRDRGEVLHAGVLASASDELRDLGQITAHLWAPVSHLCNASVSLDPQPSMTASL